MQHQLDADSKYTHIHIYKGFIKKTKKVINIKNARMSTCTAYEVLLDQHAKLKYLQDLQDNTTS